MEKKRVLNIVLGMVALAALVVVGAAAFNPGPTAPPVAARPTEIPTLRPTLAPASPAPAIGATLTVTAAPKPPSAAPATLTPPVTTPATGGFPTITNGPEYPAQFAQEGLFIRPVAGTPLVSREAALKAMVPRTPDDTFTIVSDHQIVINGQTILFTAYYGLVTVGYRGPNGLWAGSFLNIPLHDCTKGTCQPTGETLDHIENRPMWLFDLQITVALSHATCPPAGTPCPQTIDPNHQVNLVDAQTLMFIGGVSYYGS